MTPADLRQAVREAHWQELKNGPKRSLLDAMADAALAATLRALIAEQKAVIGELRHRDTTATRLRLMEAERTLDRLKAHLSALSETPT